MLVRPAFIHKKQIPLESSLDDLPTQTIITMAMPIEVLEEDMTIPAGRQYIVYQTLEIPDGMTLYAAGALVIL